MGGCRPTAPAAQRHGTPPVVLVIHEIFGVHEHIKDLCRRLAHAGYPRHQRPTSTPGSASTSQIPDVATLMGPDGTRHPRPPTTR